jgi:hypothetical protein
MPNLQKSLHAESLKARRPQSARPDVLRKTPELRGSKLPHEMSYSTDKTLQYGVTPAQESGVAVHMFRQLRTAIEFFTAPGMPQSLQPRARGSSCGIDSERLAPKMPACAAFERAARFVSAAVKDATAPMPASMPASSPLIIVE